MFDLYSEEILALFDSCSHAGQLAASVNVIHAQKGQSGFGDVVELWLQIDNGYITQAKFKALGGVHLIAAMQWLCQFLSGKPIAEAEKISVDFCISTLDLPATKTHVAIMLTELVATLLEHCHERA